MSCNKQNELVGLDNRASCVEGLTVAFLLDTKDNRTKTFWESRTSVEQAIRKGELLPFYEVYQISDDLSEPKKYESRNYSKVLSKEIKKLKGEVYTSLCEQKNILNLDQNSRYKRIIEYTEAGELLLVKKDNFLIGQKIKTINVSTRHRATEDKVPYTTFEVTMQDSQELDRNGVVLSVDWNLLTDIPPFIVVDVVRAEASNGADTINILEIDKGCGIDAETAQTILADMSLAPDYASQTDTITYVNENDATITFSVVMDSFIFNNSTMGDFIQIGMLAQNATLINGAYYHLKGKVKII